MLRTATKELAVNPEPPSPSTKTKPMTTGKPTSKPRVSLVERQSLHNRPVAPAKRRTSTLHNPLSQSSPQDVFRFPSESPPKKSASPPKPTSPVRSPVHSPVRSPRRGEDKENVVPVVWPPVQGGRERRRTFNATMEKLQQMTREEMQGDWEWEENLKAKRRRQSVAL